jgi:hypothetical protein
VDSFVYEREVEILDEHGQLLRRHEKKAARGKYELPPEDRLFNPSRETARLIGKAVKIGPHSAQLAREIFAAWAAPARRPFTVSLTSRATTAVRTSRGRASRY